MALITVPQIDYLEGIGFIDEVKDAYLVAKELKMEEFPYIKKIDDDLMAKYIAYYLIIFGKYKSCHSIIEGIDIASEDLTVDEQGKVFEYEIEISKLCIESLYEKFAGSEEATLKKYYDYKDEMKKIFTKRPSVILFMKFNYNPYYLNAIKLYYLHDRVGFEKVDLDESYESLLYYFYTILEMHNHKKFFKKPFEFRKKIKAKNLEDCKMDIENVFEKLSLIMHDMNYYYTLRANKLQEATIVTNYVDTKLAERSKIQEDNNKKTNFQRVQKNNE